VNVGSENARNAIAGTVLDEQAELTLAEFCGACAVEVETVIGLVNEGVLEPIGGEPRFWRFTGVQLRRATVAVRLQRDLGVNLAGVALTLQLLDEIENLQTRLRALGA
jgi:chaperone modulatory protein CbpM